MQLRPMNQNTLKSLEEIIHAYILAVVRDLENRQKLKAWRFHLLTVTFEFIVCLGEDVYWKQAKLREDTEVLYKVVTRNALQRIYEINMVLAKRTGQRSLRNAQLSALYQTHLQQLDSQEKITTNYITEVVKLYKHLLSNQAVAKLLSRMDEEWGKENPMNSVTKLAALHTKSRTPENALWILQVVYDQQERSFSDGTLGGSGPDRL
eukprot:937230-Amphidinium_carterae.1